MGSGAEIFNSVINQGGTPAMLSNTLSLRPAFGYRGRIFIATDTREIYRDTGTSWELIGSGAVSSVNIYNSDGTLTGARILTFGGNNLDFVGSAATNRFFSNGRVGFNTTTDAGFLADFNGSVAIRNGLSVLTSGVTINNVANGGGVLNLATIANVVARITDGSITKFEIGGPVSGSVSVLSGGQVGSLNTLFLGGSSFVSVISTTVDRHGSSTFVNRISKGYQGPGRNLNGDSQTVLQVDNRFNGTGANGNVLTGLFVSINTVGFNSYIAFTNDNGNNVFNTVSGSTIVGGSAVNGTAKFQIDSTTQGFLKPRQTTIERNAIVTPATGLEIFNTTTNRPNFFDGTAWRELTNIYLNDGTLISDRTLTGGGFLFNVINTRNTATADVANYAQYTLLNQNLSASGSTFGASFYVGGTLLNRTTFAGSYDFGSATINSGGYSGTTLLFTGSGTVTMNQAGLRAYSGHHVFNQFGGTASGTISHFAGLQILGLYNQNSGTVTPTITNAYGIVINNLNDYSHTFTLTNRWGLFQTGGSDNNYLAGKLLVGTQTVTARQVHIAGDIEFTTTLSGTSGSSSGQHLIVWVNGTQYKIDLRNP